MIFYFSGTSRPFEPERMIKHSNVMLTFSEVAVPGRDLSHRKTLKPEFRFSEIEKSRKGLPTLTKTFKLTTDGLVEQ